MCYTIVNSSELFSNRSEFGVRLSSSVTGCGSAASRLNDILAIRSSYLLAPCIILDLTVAMKLARAAACARPDVSESSRWIGLTVARGVAALGKKNEIVAITPYLLAPPRLLCYESTGRGNECVVAIGRTFVALYFDRSMFNVESVM